MYTVFVMLHCSIYGVYVLVQVLKALRLEIDRYIDLPIFKYFTDIGFEISDSPINAVVLRITRRIAIAAQTTTASRYLICCS